MKYCFCQSNSEFTSISRYSDQDQLCRTIFQTRSFERESRHFLRNWITRPQTGGHSGGLLAPSLSFSFQRRGKLWEGGICDRLEVQSMGELLIKPFSLFPPAIFPYIVLITLLVKGLTLPGALEGILFYITPEWGQLLNVKVWYAAVTQSFFSLSTGFGALITYASYNDFKHNSYRDALIISFTDTFTSLLAGFVIFAILGSLAHELGVPVSEVVDSGPGLAFVSYPSALAKFDFLPQLFSVLFFLMLVTVIT